VKRYTLAYLAWLVAVLAAAAGAAAWYRHVEQIGWREVASKIGEDDNGEG
jgi:hypothetical protein